MKKIIYIIGLFISLSVFAQTNSEKYLQNGEPKFYFEGQENKTTDPNAASNRKFELRPNYFNWMNEIFPLNSNVDVITFSDPIFNPFRAYAQSGTIREIASEEYQFLDFFPKDGWELISEKFGWLWNNSSNPAKGAMVSDPAFLLYNRYTGKLRVVFALSKGATFNNLISAQIRLFQNKIEGLENGTPNTFTISTIEAPLIPLDNKANFESDKATNSITLSSGFNSKLGSEFSADIVIAEQTFSCLSNPNGVVALMSSQAANSVNTLTTEVEENISCNNDNISIYPNPNKGNFIIDYSGELDANASIEIYNLNGQILYKTAIFEKKQNIVFTYNPGVYVIKIINGISVYSDKLILE